MLHAVFFYWQNMPKFGGDYLGGTHFEHALLKAHQPGDVAGIFYRTFPKPNEPTAKKTIIRMCQSGHFSEIVIHLAPFDGSHRYPISNLITRVLSDSADLEKIQRLYPNTQLMLSPFCENGHTAKELKPVFDGMVRAAPKCLMVNSTTNGTEVPGVITEIHIPDANHLPRQPIGPHTVSFDGFGGQGTPDFMQSNIKVIILHYPNARHIRWWDFKCNGKRDWEDQTPISQRDTWPDITYIQTRRAHMSH